MSVIVNGMEMPNNCGECNFLHFEGFIQWCCLTGSEDVFYDAKPSSCPLAEEVVHGKWIEIDDYGDAHYQCDQCKEEYVLIDGTPKENQYNYCPNCGAKMEVKE